MTAARRRSPAAKAKTLKPRTSTVFVVVKNYFEDYGTYYGQPNGAPGDAQSAYVDKEHAEKVALRLTLQQLKMRLYVNDSLANLCPDNDCTTVFTTATASLLAKHGVSHVTPEGPHEQFNRDIYPKIRSVLLLQRGNTINGSVWNEELLEQFADTLELRFYSVEKVHVFHGMPTDQMLDADDAEFFELYDTVPETAP